MTGVDITEDSEEDGSDCAIAMVATSSERLPSVAKIKKACGLEESLVERMLSKFRRDSHKQFKIHYRPSTFDRDIDMKFDLNKDGM